MKLLTLIVLVSVFPLLISAQINPHHSNYTFYGGIVLPQEYFSKIVGENPGYAQFGYGAMIEHSSKIIQNVSWTSSLSLAINSFDESSLQNQLYPHTVSSGSYYSTWLLTGIGLEVNISPSIKIYGLGQMGGLYIIIPDVIETYDNQKISRTTTSNLAFAYGIGGGLVFNNINFAIRYMNSKPEYDQWFRSMGISGNITGKLHVSIIQFLIGINL